MPSDLILPVAGQYAFCSSMLGAAVSDLSDEQAGARMRDDKGSSITFILGHLMASRAMILQTLGKREDNPWGKIFTTKEGAKAASDYPPIKELAGQWAELAKEFDSVLAELDDATLMAAGPDWIPSPDQTNRGMLGFFAFHESYHIGQIGLIRVEHGLPSIQALVHPETVE